jgi:hypothetical protein
MHDSTKDLLKLRELPELPPPPCVWERVLAAEAARAGARRLRRRFAALAAVVVVAVTAGAIFVNAPDEGSETDLPESRPLMAGSTASTIVELEDRIAFVDAQLSYAAAQGVGTPYRQVLWGERVDLMNALVAVRFAHAQ